MLQTFSTFFVTEVLYSTVKEMPRNDFGLSKFIFSAVNCELTYI